MNEETNAVLIDEDDIFDPADFDLTDEPDNQIDEPEETEEPAAEKPETEIENTEQKPETDTGSEEQPAAEPEETFELKFNKETRKVNREEMTTLAQKGLNHDRIQQQRDHLQEQVNGLSQFRTQNEPILGELNRIAQQYGVEPAEFLTAMERNMLRGKGMTDAEAEATIAREKSDRELAAYRQQEQERQRQTAVQKRQQDDINAFVQKYPEMDYSTIPESVWAEVRSGDTLVNAYGRYEAEQLRTENQRLQSQLAVQSKNEKNKQNAIGSMKSGSGVVKTDPFMDGFNDTD